MKKVVLIIILVLLFLSACCKSSTCQKISIEENSNYPCCKQTFPISASVIAPGKIKLTFYPDRVTYYPGVKSFIAGVFNSDKFCSDCLKKNVKTEKDLKNLDSYFLKKFSAFGRETTFEVINVPYKRQDSWVYLSAHDEEKITVGYFVEINNNHVSFACSADLYPVRMFRFAINLFPFAVTPPDLYGESVGSFGMVTSNIDFLPIGGFPSLYLEQKEDLGIVDEITPFIYAYYDTEAAMNGKYPYLPIGFCYREIKEGFWKCEITKNKWFELKNIYPLKIYPVLLQSYDRYIMRVIVNDVFRDLRLFEAKENEDGSVSVTSSVIARNVIDIAPRLNLLKANGITSLYFYYVTGVNPSYVSALDWFFNPVSNSTVVVDNVVASLYPLFTDKEFSPKDFCYRDQDFSINCVIGDFSIKFALGDYSIPGRGYVYYKWGNNPYILSLQVGHYSFVSLSVYPDDGWGDGEELKIKKVESNITPDYEILDKLCCTRKILMMGGSVLSLPGEFNTLNELYYIPFENYHFGEVEEETDYEFANSFYWPTYCLECCGNNAIMVQGNSYEGTGLKIFRRGLMLKREGNTYTVVYREER